jgi:O-antigen ligase/Flp pilus assembly protein TadD
VFGWVLLAGAFVVGLGLERPADRRRLLIAVGAVSIPIGSYAIAQRLGVDPFDWSAGALVRPVSTVGNASFLGAFMAVALVAVVGRVVLERAARWWWAVAVLDLVVLVLTGARGAWIGAAIALAMIGIRAWTGGDSRVVTVGMLGAVAVVALLAVAVPGVALRAASFGKLTEGTAGGRLALAHVGFDAVLDRPVLGWGTDLSRPAIHEHLLADFEARYGDTRIEDRVHNTVLDIAVWAGLLGVGAFVWFVVSFVRTARRRADEASAWITLAALAAFAAHLLFNFPVPELDVVMWMLMGSVVAAFRRLPPAPVGVVVPVVVLGGALLVPSAIDNINADRLLRQGVDHENAGNSIVAGKEYQQAAAAAGGAQYQEILSRFSMRAGQGDAAVNAARAVVRADPADPYARELLAGAFDTAAGLTGDRALAVEAEAILREEIAHAPYDGSLHTELGVSLAAQQRWDDALVALRRAEQLLPRSAAPVRNQGLVAAQRGDKVEAVRLLRRALEIDPGDQPSKDALAKLM